MTGRRRAAYNGFVSDATFDTRSLVLEGPAGALEAMLHAPSAPPEGTPVTVLCHPHPLYGGSMHDPVLDAVAEALLAAGSPCLRFNSRGVGASAGGFDEGRGESDDALTAARSLLERYPGRPLRLAGYSFGACVAWRAVRGVVPGTPLAGALLVAPPVTLLDFSDGGGEGTAVEAFAGDADDFVPLDGLRAWCERLEPPARLHIVPGADHFFMGAWHRLTEAVRATL